MKKIICVPIFLFGILLNLVELHQSTAVYLPAYNNDFQPSNPEYSQREDTPKEIIIITTTIMKIDPNTKTKTIIITIIIMKIGPNMKTKNIIIITIITKIGLNTETKTIITTIIIMVGPNMKTKNTIIITIITKIGLNTETKTIITTITKIGPKKKITIIINGRITTTLIDLPGLMRITTKKNTGERNLSGVLNPNGIESLSGTRCPTGITNTIITIMAINGSSATNDVNLNRIAVTITLGITIITFFYENRNF
ncbi:hypothetical protein FO519_003971 [Halicephalobus sp. NKZ332]|nr:hypothetical protein FO519_003971 [Halicephalobus sp. NKZ332]